MSRIALVDYGMGNVFSVFHGLKAVGLEPVTTTDPSGLDDVDGVVIPGVGAMPDAMAALNRQGLVQPLRAAADRGMPILGICLGFQLLLEEGTEFGRHTGLGLLPGVVERLPTGGRGGGGELPVPNVQWMDVHPAGAAEHPHPFDQLKSPTPFYFAHSFHVVVADRSQWLASARYGELEICAAAGRGSVCGCQFHPERSGSAGLAVLARFAETVSMSRPSMIQNIR